MCVIASGRDRKPTLLDFKAMELGNPDGAGVAWCEGGKVSYVKGLTADAVYRIVQRARHDWVAHFRIATVGEKTDELTHPFVVSPESPLKLAGTTDYVLFHNGHWGAWKSVGLAIALRGGQEIPDGAWSDSRAAAFIAAIAGHRALELMDGKYALLGPGGFQLFPRDRVGWDSEDGMWFSNTYWKSKRYDITRTEREEKIESARKLAAAALATEAVAKPSEDADDPDLVRLMTENCGMVQGCDALLPDEKEEEDRALQSEVARMKGERRFPQASMDQ